MIFGTGACYENLKRLQCAIPCWHCSALIKNYVSSPGYFNMTYYVSQNFAQRLLDSCSTVCITAATGGNATTLATAASSPAQFMEMLKTDYDPTYTLSITSPRITFTIGTSPLQTSFDADLLPVDTGVPCGDQCSGGTPLIPRNLSFCDMHTMPKSSCCLDFKEKIMGSTLPNRMTGIVGTDCCYKNLKNMFCSWMCASDNLDWVDWVKGPDSIQNMTMYISQTAANTIWNSCKNHPFKLGGCREMSKRYNGPTDFLAQFNSDNDPNHHPNIMVNRVKFHVGTHPTSGMGWDPTNLLQACGEDTQGCQASDNNVASSLTYSISLFAFLLLLFVSPF
jgi:hypothetical protein